MSPNLDIIVKDPLVRDGLALFPLFSTTAPAPAYLTGPEAERLGVLRVAERPGGASVPELVVHNTGPLPLLLIEGETLVGGKQNRTLDTSVLVPAGVPTTIEVSCVEVGRWGPPRASARSASHAPPDLRRVKTTALSIAHRQSAKQAEVWQRIGRYQAEFAVPSATGALEDVAASQTAEIASLVTGLRPLPDQCGVAVSIGGELRSVDVFDKPATLTAYWDALTAGYALDAMGSSTAAQASIDDVVALIARVGAATRTAARTAGLGETATLVGDGVVGNELRWDGASVHISAFVDETL